MHPLRGLRFLYGLSCTGRRYTAAIRGELSGICKGQRKKPAELFFSGGLRAKAQGHGAAGDLQRSVAHDFSGFTVCYQVQVRSESYHVYGAEALLRYTAPLRGEIPPTEFVPVLEQTGLVYPVGLWVMERALEQCRRWRSVLPEFHVGVNMSYRQLRDASIEQDVLELLRQVRGKYPKKSVWVFTGYTLDGHILSKKLGPWPVTEELLSYIDVLVDGPFLAEEKDLSLRFRGSRNQRLIDLRQTLALGQIVLWTDWQTERRS